MKNLTLFISLLLFYSCDNKKVTVDDSEVKRIVDSTVQAATKETIKANEVKKNWEYDIDVDKMSDTSFFALCTSTNEVQFKFPYDGGSRLKITLRKKGEKNNAIITISKGQFIGRYNDQDNIKLKFDDEKPFSLKTLSPADGSTDAIFISDEKKFINKLKNAKKLIIEVSFYQEGNNQFEFDIHDLNWK